MVEYPRALRIAHHVVYFHAGDARAYVDGKIAEAEQANQEREASEWRKVGHFVDRLLGDSALPSQMPPARRRPAVRPRRLGPR